MLDADGTRSKGIARSLKKIGVKASLLIASEILLSKLLIYYIKFLAEFNYALRDVGSRLGIAVYTASISDIESFKLAFLFRGWGCRAFSSLGKSKIVVEKNSSKCSPTIPHNLSLCVCFISTLVVSLSSISNIT